MDESKVVKQIAEWMVKEGTKNTTEGNWIFHIDEIKKEFNVSKMFVAAYCGEIFDSLYEHESVADVECTLQEGSDFYVKTFDVDFYTKFCPNVEDKDWSEIV